MLDQVSPLSQPFDLAGRRVFVAGHRGMVGSACVRRLEREECEVLTVPRKSLNLIDQSEVEIFMAAERPEVVIIAAAKVGGILANENFAAEFLYENLMIQTNLIHAAHRVGVTKLLFLGSSCIYPSEAPQPIPEEALLTGPVEKTNEWYAVAKIAGIKLCQAYRRQHGCDFISAMPCNLYGPNDYFHPERSHVIPALLRRFHAARLTGAESVTCWGSGQPRREFLHVDDLAEACVFLLKYYSQAIHINIGTGSDVTISELSEMVRRITRFEGRIDWDRSKPDGAMLKRMDVQRSKKLGWNPQIPLEVGLADTYEWFQQQPKLRM